VEVVKKAHSPPKSYSPHGRALMDPSRKGSVTSDMGSRFGSNDRSISNSYRIIEPDKSYRNDPEQEN
jgi:hypothetical protein